MVATDGDSPLGNEKGAHAVRITYGAETLAPFAVFEPKGARDVEAYGDRTSRTNAQNPSHCAGPIIYTFLGHTPGELHT